MHRKATHTVGFALAVGLAAGALGLIRAAPDGRHRHLRDALVGGVIACSHIALDNLPYVKMSTKSFVPRPGRRRVAGMSVANWLLDVALCALLSWVIRSAARRSP